MPVADCNDFRGFPHKDFAVLARIFDEPFRRLAGRRAERLGRFPSSRPAASVRRLGTPVEMAETDTKSRGPQRGAIAQGARRQSRDTPRLEARIPNKRGG
jgi:hypothetical protein